MILNNVKDFRAEDFSCPAGLKCALTVTGSRNRNVRIASEEIDAANACLSARAAAAVTIE